MAEPIVIDTTQAAEVKVVKTSRLKNFKNKHPRIMRVLGLLAITAATFGALSVVKSKKVVITAEPPSFDVSVDDSSETTTH